MDDYIDKQPPDNKKEFCQEDMIKLIKNIERVQLQINALSEIINILKKETKKFYK